MGTFIPPQNFGMVEENLYRGGQPSQLNFPFLEKLRLRKIIWLAPDEPQRQLCAAPRLHLCGYEGVPTALRRATAPRRLMRVRLRRRTWLDDQGIEIVQLAETVGSHNPSNTVSEEVRERL